MRALLATFPAVTLLRGGVEVQVRSLAQELRHLGVEAELFDPWKRYRLADYRLIHLFGAHVGNYHLGRAAKALGMRLIVSPVYYSRKSPLRVATAVRTSAVLRRLGAVWTEYQFCKELCDMSDLVLPNTKAEMELVSKGFGVPESKMLVLPNGVDEAFARATPDAFVARYGTSGFVLYVGHIGWKRKNLLRLLEVLGRVKRGAVLIGPVVRNDYATRCLDHAKSLGNVTVIPGLDPEDPLLASAYAACDAFVLPSDYETPGLSALEAGLAGAKVCLTAHGGTREYFGSMADYVEPNSVDSIEKGLRSALGRRKNADLSDHIRRNYLWGRAAEILAGAYRSLG